MKKINTSKLAPKVTFVKLGYAFFKMHFTSQLYLTKLL